MSATCPMCEGVFIKPPQRKTRCKSCGQFVFFKATPTDSVKKLVSEQRAAEIDAAWIDELEKRRETLEFHDSLDSVGIAKGSKLQRFAKAIKKYERGGDGNGWSNQRVLASTLAYCAHALNLDPRVWEVEAAICALRQFESIPSWHDHLMISTGSTEPQCKYLDGARYSLAQAFAEMPIPSGNCSNSRNAAGFPLCHCSWLVDLDAVSASRGS